ncbi:MAG: hypothetical protein HZB55_05565 [Deltaproteobacteria bacterium]|nr:hypothetical protein [Deltaproteobacteria bacterium]
MCPPGEHPKSLTWRCVVAILAGRKTQLRQAIDPQPPDGAQVSGVDEDGRLHWTLGGGGGAECPMGRPGHRLWVREPWAGPARLDGDPNRARLLLRYRAGEKARPSDLSSDTVVWRPAAEMPRWASRLTLEVLELRAQRIQGIGSEDLQAEGGMWRTGDDSVSAEADREAFGRWWTEVNPESRFAWDQDPWVWVVRFRRLALSGREAGPPKAGTP